MTDDLAWADAFPGQSQGLGEIFCLTFVKGVDAAEALRRMGGLPDTLATRTWAEMGALHNFDDGYPMVAGALPLGEWTVVFEPDGFEGAHLAITASRGTEVVSVLRHDYASDSFVHAVAGVLVTGFDPAVHRTTSGALRQAEDITGVLPTYDALTGPLLSAYLQPWFTDAPKEPAGRPGHDGPVDAVTEVRRLTELHGLTGTPGLAEALATRGPVPPESPLGRHVRDWLTEARRASWSLNDNSGHHMTEDERRRAFDLGWLTRALGAALQE